MRWRLAAVALLVVGTSALVGAAAFASIAQPNVTCMLPGVLGCIVDSECAPYGAVCDVSAGTCACPSSDAGSGDGGNLDGGAGGGGGGGGGTGGTGGSGGGTVSGTGPRVGGGMSGPPKSSGCSFVPGSAR